MGQVLRQARKTREVLDPCLLKAGFLVVCTIFVGYQSVECVFSVCGDLTTGKRNRMSKKLHKRVSRDSLEIHLDVLVLVLWVGILVLVLVLWVGVLVLVLT